MEEFPLYPQNPSKFGNTPGIRDSSFSLRDIALLSSAFSSLPDGFAGVLLACVRVRDLSGLLFTVGIGEPLNFRSF